MRSLLTFCLSLFVCMSLHAQTTLYTQNFNTGTAADWSLNTADLGGDASLADNQWIINNTYAGGTIGGLITVPATADEPAGITGAPESYYMHIYSAQGATLGGPSNDNFDAGGTGDTYFAAMNTTVNTSGYTNVYFSFWWICKGNAACSGKAYYRTSTSGTWTQITAPVATFYNSAVWTNDSFHLAAFDNQATLQFAFQFTDGNSTGTDPAFGVDDITVTGVSGSTVTPPVASFTVDNTTLCQDSCANVASTTTGTVDSVRWTVSPTTGATIAAPTANAGTICFSAAGTYTVTLTAYNSGGSDAASNVITVNPAPIPAITQTGTTLSVVSPGMYTAFQWVENSGTIIPGATSSTYTYSIPATYNVIVDSGGCYGISNTISTLGAAIINSVANRYWLAQPDNNTISLNATQPLQEALEVNVYDAAGRKMLTEVWGKGATAAQVSSTFLSQGLYIIKLSGKDNILVFKYMKG